MHSNTEAFNSNTGTKFSVETCSHNSHFSWILLTSQVSCSVGSLYPKWRKHTQQCNPLLVDCDRCCSGTFVDVYGPIDPFSPLLVQESCDSVVVVFECSNTHENVSWLRLPNLGFAWSPCLGKHLNVPSAIFNVKNQFFYFVT